MRILKYVLIFVLLLLVVGGVLLWTLPADVDYRSTTRFSREDWVTLLQ